MHIFRIPFPKNTSRRLLLKENDSVKLTISSVIGSVNRFRCYKPNEIPSFFIYVFGFIMNISLNYEFISSYSENLELRLVQLQSWSCYFGF